MPVDNKRINGPDNTIPYRLFTKLNLKSFREIFNEAVKTDGTRLDGRKTNQHRLIFVKTGIVSQAKGSAYIEVNKTKVIVSVFDPREIPNKTDYKLNGELYCEFKYAPFSCLKRRLHQQDADEKQNSIILKRALESAVCCQEFPNFQVDIYALVLQNDGSALSAAITCAGLALAHAGIPMFSLITSVTLGIQGNTKLLDPTVEEENLCQIDKSNKEDGKKYNNSHGIVILSLLSTHQQISELYQTGNLSVDDLAESIEILTKANKESIIPIIEKSLVKYVIKNNSSGNEL